MLVTDQHIACIGKGNAARTGGVVLEELDYGNVKMKTKPALYKHRLVLLMIYTTARSKY